MDPLWLAHIFFQMAQPLNKEREWSVERPFGEVQSSSPGSTWSKDSATSGCSISLEICFLVDFWLIIGVRIRNSQKNKLLINWQMTDFFQRHFLQKHHGQVLFLVTVSNLAALPRHIARLVEGSGHQMFWHRAIWSGLVFLQWFQRCLVMIFSLEISVRLWTLVKFRHCQVAWAIVLSPIQLVVVGSFWIGLELPYSMEESWVPFLVFLVALALCILLRFCQDLGIL